MSRFHRCLAINLAVALSMGTTFAAESPARESVEQLFEKGVTLREQGKDLEALAAFKQARTQCDCPRALAQVGLAEQALGRWLDAESHVRGALAATGDPWIEKHRATLGDALAKIAQHLGDLDVVGGVPGAEVTVAGRSAGTLPLPRPVRVVAGSTILEVKAAGFVALSRPVLVTPGGLARETVELVPAPRLELPPAQSPEAATSPAPGAGTTDHSALRRKLGFASLAGAVVFIGGGFSAYAVRESKAGDWNNDSRCLANGLTREQNCASDRQATELAQSLEIAGFAVGGALAVTSVVLLAMPARKDTAKTALRVGGGPGQVGLSAAWEF